MAVISAAGKVRRRWGKPGSEHGEFNFIPGDPTSPTDIDGKIAVGTDGEVNVSDSGNARVQVFTPQGKLIRQFGSFGTGKGHFLHPFDIAVYPTGDAYVVDGQVDVVSRFSPAGERPMARRSPYFGPCGEVFALAADGSILRLRMTLPEA